MKLLKCYNNMGIEENIKKLENEKSKNKQVEKISEISFIGNIISENIKNGFKDVYEKTYNSSLLIHGVELLKKMDVVKGEDGYTPIKGHDYFTKDQAKKFLELVSPVITVVTLILVLWVLGVMGISIPSIG